MDPLLSAHMLREAGLSCEMALCLHGRDGNLETQKAALQSSKALDIHTIFIIEPPLALGKNECTSSTLDILNFISTNHKSNFEVFVENAFLHEADLRLLQKQMDAGARRVITRHPNMVEKHLGNSKAKMVMSLHRVSSEEQELVPTTAILDLSHLSGEAVITFGDQLFL